MTSIIAFALLIMYTLIICVVNKQIPNSLSASVFLLPPSTPQSPSWRPQAKVVHGESPCLPPSGVWLWTVIITAIAVLTMPALLDITPEKWQFIAFLGCAALGFVAAAPLVRDKGDMAYKVHCTAAVVCAICSQALVVIICPWLLMTWIPWIAAFVWITKDERWLTQVFWAEMVCFTSTFTLPLV